MVPYLGPVASVWDWPIPGISLRRRCWAGQQAKTVTKNGAPVQIEFPRLLLQYPPTSSAISCRYLLHLPVLFPRVLPYFDIARFGSTSLYYSA